MTDQQEVRETNVGSDGGKKGQKGRDPNVGTGVTEGQRNERK